MNTNYAVRFVSLILALLMVMTGSVLCFAQENAPQTQADEALADGAGASSEADKAELTKKERLKNTVYLQDLNYAASVHGALTVINPDDKSVMPSFRNGKFYVPLRFVMENFGLEVSWNQQTKTVVLMALDIEYRLRTADSVFALGGFEVPLSNPCVIERGTTYVAFEDLSKMISCDTHYYEDYRSGVISLGSEWDAERDAEKQAFEAMEFAVSPFFKMFT